MRKNLSYRSILLNFIEIALIYKISLDNFLKLKSLKVITLTKMVGPENADDMHN
jgi:hypothetical protein